MFNASSNTPLHRLQKHSLLMAGLLALALVMAISLSAGMGYMKIAWVDVLRVVGGSLTGNAALIADVDELTRVIVMDVRLPRILTAAAVGGGLALCGVVFQGILLNPLADPYTLGVSAGAAFGAALALLLNLTVAGIYSVPVCAFAGATATLMLVVYLSSSAGGANANNLILSGIIVAAILSAGISFLKFVADEQVSVIIFWLMGSFASKTWTRCGPVQHLPARRAVGLRLLRPRSEPVVSGAAGSCIAGRGCTPGPLDLAGYGLAGGGSLRVRLGHHRFRGAAGAPHDACPGRAGQPSPAAPVPFQRGDPALVRRYGNPGRSAP